jgi:hypothetical protein
MSQEPAEEIQLQAKFVLITKLEEFYISNYLECNMSYEEEKYLNIRIHQNSLAFRFSD